MDAVKPPKQATLRARLAPVLLVVLASPVIAELLTSSAPPGVFFTPWVFVLFAGLYGTGALLVREAAVRWNAGWPSILLLGCAFGILEEGVAAKSFFDPAWRALGPLEDHGRVFGVNWVWLVALTLFHASYSIGLPLLLSRAMHPQHQGVPWLPRSALWSIGVVFVLNLVLFHQHGNAYPVEPALTAWSLVAAGVLTVLARSVAHWQPAAGDSPAASARSFFALGATGGIAFVASCYLVPLVSPHPLVTAACFCALAGAVAHLLTRWSGTGFDDRRRFFLFAGALVPYLLLGPFQEVNPSRSDSARGMALVSAGGVAVLWWMARRIGRDSAVS